MIYYVHKVTHQNLWSFYITFIYTKYINSNIKTIYNYLHAGIKRILLGGGKSEGPSEGEEKGEKVWFIPCRDCCLFLKKKTNL